VIVNVKRGSAPGSRNRHALLRCAIALIAPLIAGCSSTDLRPKSISVQPPACSLLADAQRSTLAYYEVKTAQLVLCNEVRAERRFTPASTFKIAHSLLALESEIVRDELAPLKWDRRARGVAAWDKDTSLDDAVAASTVWVFQEIAGKLGHKNEARFVHRLGYGNTNVGAETELRHFWLSGPLAISAREQLGFLAKLRAKQLDVDPALQERVIAMLKLRECGTDCTIYGKTAAVLPIDDEGFLRPGNSTLLPQGEQPIGWFVGWVERPDADGGPLIFAHNIDLDLPGAMAARTAKVYDLLQTVGISVATERK